MAEAHLTEDEQARLLKACAANCACQPDDSGMVLHSCPAHAMLTNDDLLKRLAFMRHQRLRLIEQEHMT